MSTPQFYNLLRVLFNTTLAVSVIDTDWQWLIDNDYIVPAGSASFRTTDKANTFCLSQFDKILRLGL